jgi:hypothetical protein
MFGCATVSTFSQGRVIRFFSRIIGWIIDLLYFRRINIRKLSFHSRAVLLGSMLGLLIRGVTWQFEDSSIIATLATATAYITFVLYEELLDKPVYFEVSDRFFPQFISSRIIRRNSFGCLSQVEGKTLSRSMSRIDERNN